MKNKLERFVNEHRDAFDLDLPGRDVWSSIDTTPAPRKGIRHLLTWPRIAAALLIVANAIVIFFLLGPKPPAEAVTAPPAVAQQAPADSLSRQTLDLISRRVELKQAALKEIASSHPTLYKTFQEAQSQLSSMYNELEKEFANSPNREALLEAMIQNLVLQQDLLNRQLSIYQKLKQQPHDKPDKAI